MNSIEEAQETRKREYILELYMYTLLYCFLPIHVCANKIHFVVKSNWKPMHVFYAL